MDFEILSLKEAISQFNIFIAIGIFILYLVIEMLDSSLTFSLTQHKSARSAAVTFILYLTIAIEIAVVISNYLYVIPLAAGAALGSYIVVEYEKKKRPLKSKTK